MIGVRTLIVNLLGVIGRWVWYRLGWIRASWSGVRLGHGARVSPRAAVAHAYYFGDVVIGAGVTIGHGSYVNSGYVDCGRIGHWCSIGYGVHIGPTEHKLDEWSTSPLLVPPKNVSAEPSAANEFRRQRIPPVIGDDVWVGANAVILCGVSIGDGVVIGAGAVVTRDLPPYCVAAGVPARIIRQRFASDTDLIVAKARLAQQLKQAGVTQHG